MAEETEQMIWYSDVWSRRFVVWIAGMNPAGVEPSEWAVVSKCGQELRAQLGARSLIWNNSVDLQGSSAL